MNYNDDEIKAAMQKFRSLPRGTPEWMEAFEFLDGLGVIEMTIRSGLTRELQR